MKNRLLNWLYRKGWMQVQDHLRVVKYKNKTIELAMHELIEKDRIIDALSHTLAAKLTGLKE